jgi:transposase
MTPSRPDAIISLPGFRLVEVRHNLGIFEIQAALEARPPCPHCACVRVWVRSKKERRVRHESFGTRPSWLIFTATKYECRGCKKFFYPRMMGIGLFQRSSERFKDEITDLHHKGITQVQLSRDYALGCATVERWYHEHIKIKLHEYKNRPCPRVMGIDEHFFTRKKGFATTLADLSKQKVFEVTLGRSDKSLEEFFKNLIGKNRVKVMLMDLSETYRSICKKQFPNALLVADRFHVVRLINQQFLKVWRRFDERARYNRGLLSLMRRHQWNLKPEQEINLLKYLEGFPVLKEIYFFKQQLNSLMLEKCHTQRSARPLVHQFLSMIEQLKTTAITELKTLGETLWSWREEVARMWRFTKTNSILEGLHNKMEMISRRAFGFRTFENYRIRVLAHCGG